MAPKGQRRPPTTLRFQVRVNQWRSEWLPLWAPDALQTDTHIVPDPDGDTVELVVQAQGAEGSWPPEVPAGDGG